MENGEKYKPPHERQAAEESAEEDDYGARLAEYMQSRGPNELGERDDVEISLELRQQAEIGRLTARIGILEAELKLRKLHEKKLEAQANALAAELKESKEKERIRQERSVLHDMETRLAAGRATKASLGKSILASKLLKPILGTRNTDTKKKFWERD